MDTLRKADRMSRMKRRRFTTGFKGGAVLTSEERADRRVTVTILDGS